MATGFLPTCAREGGYPDTSGVNQEKGMAVSGDQQTRGSGCWESERIALITRYSDNHYLVTRYPDAHYFLCKTNPICWILK